MLKILTVALLGLMCSVASAGDKWEVLSTEEKQERFRAYLVAEVARQVEMNRPEPVTRDQRLAELREAVKAAAKESRNLRINGEKEASARKRSEADKIREEWEVIYKDPDWKPEEPEPELNKFEWDSIEKVRVGRPEDFSALFATLPGDPLCYFLLVNDKVGCNFAIPKDETLSRYNSGEAAFSCKEGHGYITVGKVHFDAIDETCIVVERFEIAQPEKFKSQCPPELMYEPPAIEKPEGSGKIQKNPEGE